MGDALNATGRPMVYSLCNWGEDFVHSVGTMFSIDLKVILHVYESLQYIFTSSADNSY